MRVHCLLLCELMHHVNVTDGCIRSRFPSQQHCLQLLLWAKLYMYRRPLDSLYRRPLDSLDRRPLDSLYRRPLDSLLNMQ